MSVITGRLPRGSYTSDQWTWPTLWVSSTHFFWTRFSSVFFTLAFLKSPAAFSYIIGWCPQSMFCLWFFFFFFFLVRCTCTWCCLLASSCYSEKEAMLPYLWSGISNVLSLLLKDHLREYTERVASFPAQNLFEVPTFGSLPSSVSRYNARSSPFNWIWHFSHSNYQHVRRWWDRQELQSKT